VILARFGGAWIDIGIYTDAIFDAAWFRMSKSSDVQNHSPLFDQRATAGAHPLRISPNLTLRRIDGELTAGVAVGQSKTRCWGNIQLHPDPENRRERCQTRREIAGFGRRSAL
jgi:hypothetical protein